MTEILVKHISSTLSISKSQVSNTVKLLEEGATIPFISRYRKEATGSLDETEVTAIEKEWKRSLSQADETLKISEGRYKEGMGSPIEITDVRVTLLNAQILYIQSLYDYQASYVGLQKAMGALK